MSKAKIRIEYNGKTYRVGKSHGCNSKRDCDLFKLGTCDENHYAIGNPLPCEAITDAFIAVCGACPTRCYKEAAR